MEEIIRDDFFLFLLQDYCLRYIHGVSGADVPSGSLILDDCSPQDGVGDSNPSGAANLIDL
ncbi:hypothetical protein C0431_00020 [bacterium]|nr:hypothetical protein [bacterium]